MSECISAEYYGVYVSNEYPTEELVFSNKQKALHCAKSFKNARFKAFLTYSDALHFSQKGYELPNISVTDGDQYTKESLVGEKQSSIKAPKYQELVKFRKAIEAGDIDKVNCFIWDMPRYLVSSGDTPSILQEGFRYNSLHIAAKARNHEICDLILRTISSIRFIKFLYGDNSFDEELAKDRIKVLLDLYLNTPDKGLNETPLHFAVKYGAVEVVRVFLSYPQCDKMLRNKYGNTPDMIICDRCDDADVPAKRDQIAFLLEGSYYVPVLRAEDNSTAPTIGEPFSPSSPPELNNDPLSPRYEIRAYAGPLNRKEAEKFRRVWKTPPRISSNNKDTSLSNVASLRYRDMDKGLERLGNTLASKFDVGWKEYWPFLDSFVDIASKEGLELFENYLSTKMRNFLESNKDINEITFLLEGCNISESVNNQEVLENNFVNPHLCMEKACCVHATRLTNIILQTIKNPNSNIQLVLEKETVQIHSLMERYLDDSRFHSINFQSIHCRLGRLISQKIYELTKPDNIVKVFNELRDLKQKLEESSKMPIMNGISDESYMGCLLGQVLSNMTEVTLMKNDPPRTEEECVELWESSEKCSCVFQINEQKKSFRYRNSFKTKLKPNLSSVSKKLNFIEDAKSMDTDTPADECDEFYTPPTSPEPSDSEESDDYEDANTLHEDIFIEGTQPTKTDCAVYDALTYSSCVPRPEAFPNVYKWYHAVSLFSKAERKSWQKLNSKKMSTPDSSQNLNENSFVSTPYKSWFYVTGVNSPKTSLKNKFQ